MESKPESSSCSPSSSPSPATCPSSSATLISPSSPRKSLGRSAFKVLSNDSDNKASSPIVSPPLLSNISSVLMQTTDSSLESTSSFSSSILSSLLSSNLSNYPSRNFGESSTPARPRSGSYSDHSHRSKKSNSIANDVLGFLMDENRKIVFPGDNNDCNKVVVGGTMEFERTLRENNDRVNFIANDLTNTNLTDDFTTHKNTTATQKIIMDQSHQKVDTQDVSTVKHSVNDIDNEDFLEPFIYRYPTPLCSSIPKTPPAGSPAPSPSTISSSSWMISSSLSGPTASSPPPQSSSSLSPSSTAVSSSSSSWRIPTQLPESFASPSHSKTLPKASKGALPSTKSPSSSISSQPVAPQQISLPSIPTVPPATALLSALSSSSTSTLFESSSIPPARPLASSFSSSQSIPLSIPSSSSSSTPAPSSILSSSMPSLVSSADLKFPSALEDQLTFHLQRALNDINAFNRKNGAIESEINGVNGDGDRNCMGDYLIDDNRAADENQNRESIFGNDNNRERGGNRNFQFHNDYEHFDSHENPIINNINGMKQMDCSKCDDSDSHTNGNELTLHYYGKLDRFIHGDKNFSGKSNHAHHDENILNCQNGHPEDLKNHRGDIISGLMDETINAEKPDSTFNIHCDGQRQHDRESDNKHRNESNNQSYDDSTTRLRNNINARHRVLSNHQYDDEDNQSTRDRNGYRHNGTHNRNDEVEDSGSGMNDFTNEKYDEDHHEDGQHHAFGQHRNGVHGPFEECYHDALTNLENCIECSDTIQFYRKDRHRLLLLIEGQRLIIQELLYSKKSNQEFFSGHTLQSSSPSSSLSSSSSSSVPSSIWSSMSSSSTIPSAISSSTRPSSTSPSANLSSATSLLSTLSSTSTLPSPPSSSPSLPLSSPSPPSSLPSLPSSLPSLPLSSPSPPLSSPSPPLSSPSPPSSSTSSSLPSPPTSSPSSPSPPSSSPSSSSPSPPSSSSSAPLSAPPLSKLLECFQSSYGKTHFFQGNQVDHPDQRLLLDLLIRDVESMKSHRINRATNETGHQLQSFSSHDHNYRSQTGHLDGDHPPHHPTQFSDSAHPWLIDSSIAYSNGGCIADITHKNIDGTTLGLNNLQYQCCFSPSQDSMHPGHCNQVQHQHQSQTVTFQSHNRSAPQCMQLQHHSEAKQQAQIDEQKYTLPQLSQYHHQTQSQHKIQQQLQQLRSDPSQRSQKTQNSQSHQHQHLPHQQHNTQNQQTDTQQQQHSAQQQQQQHAQKQQNLQHQRTQQHQAKQPPPPPPPPPPMENRSQHGTQRSQPVQSEKSQTGQSAPETMQQHLQQSIQKILIPKILSHQSTQSCHLHQSTPSQQSEPPRYCRSHEKETIFPILCASMSSSLASASAPSSASSLTPAPPLTPSSLSSSLSPLSPSLLPSASSTFLSHHNSTSLSSQSAISLPALPSTSKSSTSLNSSQRTFSSSPPPLAAWSATSSSTASVPSMSLSSSSLSSSSLPASSTSLSMSVSSPSSPASSSLSSRSASTPSSASSAINITLYVSFICNKAERSKNEVMDRVNCTNEGNDDHSDDSNMTPPSSVENFDHDEILHSDDSDIGRSDEAGSVNAPVSASPSAALQSLGNESVLPACMSTSLYEKFCEEVLNKMNPPPKVQKWQLKDKRFAVITIIPIEAAERLLMMQMRGNPSLCFNNSSPSPDISSSSPSLVTEQSQASLPKRSATDSHTCSKAVLLTSRTEGSSAGLSSSPISPPKLLTPISPSPTTPASESSIASASESSISSGPFVTADVLSQWLIEPARPRRPMLRLTGNFPHDIDEDSNGKILDEIFSSLNPQIYNHQQRNRIKNDTSLVRRSKNQILIAIHPLGRLTVLNESKGILFYRSHNNTMNVSDHQPIILCFKCSQHGHQAKDCKSKSRCIYCSQNHEGRDCLLENKKTSQFKKCYPCILSHHSSFDTHGAIDLTICPTARQKRQQQLDLITYDPIHYNQQYLLWQKFQKLARKNRSDNHDMPSPLTNKIESSVVNHDAHAANSDAHCSHLFTQVDKNSSPVNQDNHANRVNHNSNDDKCDRITITKGHSALSEYGNIDRNKRVDYDSANRLSSACTSVISVVGGGIKSAVDGGSGVKSVVNGSVKNIAPCRGVKSTITGGGIKSFGTGSGIKHFVTGGGGKSSIAMGGANSVTGGVGVKSVPTGGGINSVGCSSMRGVRGGDSGGTSSVRGSVRSSGIRGDSLSMSGASNNVSGNSMKQ